MHVYHRYICRYIGQSGQSGILWYICVHICVNVQCIHRTVWGSGVTLRVFSFNTIQPNTPTKSCPTRPSQSAKDQPKEIDSNPQYASNRANLTTVLLQNWSSQKMKQSLPRGPCCWKRTGSDQNFEDSLARVGTRPSVKCVGMACMAENGTRGMGDGPKWAFKHASVKTSQKFQQQCFSLLTGMAAIILLLGSKSKMQDQVLAENQLCLACCGWTPKKVNKR